MIVIQYTTSAGFNSEKGYFDDADEAAAFYEAKRKTCERVVMFEIEETA